MVRFFVAPEELLQETVTLSGENAEERGLAGAVGRDEGYLVAFIDVESYIAEKDFLTVALADVLYLQIRCHWTFC